ncbi:MAG: SdrD B-like domain-containing protein [Bacteroidota bacterium]
MKKITRHSLLAISSREIAMAIVLPFRRLWQVRLAFLLIAIFTTSWSLAGQTCDCTDYIYLNDEDFNVVHKFRVNSADGSVMEIGDPWFDASIVAPGLAPHGVAGDLNGAIFIGQNFVGNNPIMKIGCTGNLIDAGAIPDLNHALTNMGSRDGIIYTTNDDEDVIAAYDQCTGALLGQINVHGGGGEVSFWGYYQDDTNWYVVDRELNCVYTGSLDISLYTFPPTNAGTELFCLDGVNRGMGLTRDADGNWYIVVRQGFSGGSNGVAIQKYSPTGTLLATINNDGDQGPNMGNGEADFWGARGIVYSPMSNLLYVSSLENCISVFDTALVQQSSLNIGNPAGGAPKGIGILTECCPTNTMLAIDETICFSGTNETVFLQELIDCGSNGGICEGTWTNTVTNSNFSFDDCASTVTVSGAGCSTFELSSPGTNSNAQCPEFTITVEVCASAPPGNDTPTTTAGTCDMSMTSNNDASITIPGISGADVVGISSAGATMYDGSSYDASAAAADLELVPGSNEVTFSGLEHGQDYFVRLFNMGNECSIDVMVTAATIDCNCTPPSDVAAFAIQASCNEDGSINDDGYLQLSTVTGGLSYEVNVGSANDGTGTRTSLVGASFPLQIQTGIENPSGSQVYNIRIYAEDVGGAANCFVDVMVTMNEQDCTLGCDCTDFIYLNEPSTGEVLKFQASPNSIGLIPVAGANGIPWYPGSSGGSQLQSPHGIAVDINGKLYIGQRGTDSRIRTLNCLGEIDPVDGSEIRYTDDYGQNFFISGSTLYYNSSGGPTANNICSGQELGQACLNDPFGNPTPPFGASNPADDNLWGLHYNENTGRVYATGRGNDLRAVWSFTLEELEASIANNTCIDPIVSVGPSPTVNVGESFLPSDAEGVFGVVSDNDGNIFVIVNIAPGEFTNSTIYKYDSTGGFLMASDLTPASDATIGITWVESVNRLYVSNFTDDPAIDCIAAFDPVTLEYLGTAAPNPNLPTNDRGKAIGTVEECCPSANNQSVYVSLCAFDTQDDIFLNELFPCDGITCEGEWTPQDAASMAIYDPCTQGVNLDNASEGCFTFVRSSDGLGANRCGAFRIEAEVCITLPPTSDEPIINAGTCDINSLPNEDASATINNISGADIAGVSTAGAVAYDGPAYAPANGVDLIDVAGGSLSLNTLEHGQDYIVRLYNMSDGCFTDVPFTTATIDCAACSLDILDVIATCNFDGVAGESTFTVQVDLSWNVASLATASELINVSFAGQSLTIDPAGITAGTDMVTFNNVSGPAYGQVIQASFATTTDCVASSYINLEACPDPCENGDLGGTVFNDENNDGIFDVEESGQENVLVEIYACNAMDPAYTVYSDENGNWSVPVEANLVYPVRVEFSTPLQSFLTPAVNGTNNRTNVQFVDAASCVVDYAVIDPPLVCETNTAVFTPCYVIGRHDNSAGPDDVFLSFNYLASGPNPNDPAAMKTVLATKDEIGSTWGVAVNPNNRDIYAAAVLKAQIGLPDNGLGSIYTIDPTGTNAPTVLVDIPNVGSIPNDVDRGLTAFNQRADDFEAVVKVGTVGLGDLEINEEGDRLYTTNLFNKKLIIIDPATGAILDSIPIPDPNCVGGEMRPWALSIHGNELFAGVVCDASVSQDRDDLTAFVYKMDLVSNTFLSTPVLSFDLDYVRGRASNGDGNSSAGFFPWVMSTIAQDFSASFSGNGWRISRPTPILSDIEFGPSGEMILGFADRTSFQIEQSSRMRDEDPAGNIPRPPNVRFFAAGGDILRALPNADGETYTIETLNYTGTGTPLEFFAQDNLGNSHTETALGGLLVLPGRNEVMTMVYDPFGIFEQGVEAYNLTNGNIVRTYKIIDDSAGDTGLSGKGTGLGDLEIFCESLDELQVGNYVWFDQDEDGVQDACEPPIDGLTVKLYTKPTTGNSELVATTTTGANGEYYFTAAGTTGETWETGFSEIVEGESYFIVFMGDSYDETTDEITVGTTNYLLTTSDTVEGNSPDQNDSDASEMTVPGLGNMPVIMFTAEETDHTFDLGLIAPLECLLTLSVAQSACIDNNDGTFTANYDLAVSWIDPPATGGITLTSSEGTLSSTTIDAATVAGSSSTTLTLSGVAADGAGTIDLTATFDDDMTCNVSNSFKAPVPCVDPVGTCSGTTGLGGTAFADADYNGQDDSDPGVAGMTVRVFDCVGNEVSGSPTYTDVDGNWAMADGIITGEEYRVEFELTETAACDYKPTVVTDPSGADNGTTVQFVTAPACADIGLSDPSQCNLQQLVYTPCYVQDDNLFGPNSAEAVGAAVPVTATGEGGPVMTVKVPGTEVGSTWGVGFQKTTSTTFVASYLKRKAGFGPDASGSGTTTGGIYVLQPHPNGSASATLFVDLATITNTGTDPHPDPADDCTSVEWGDTSNDACWFHDLNAWNQIGRMSLGDIDFSPDYEHLFAVNLANRSLIRIPVGNPIAVPTPGDITEYDLSPFYTDARSGTADWIPFALGKREDNGKMYLGATANAETTQNADQLDALVYEFDPTDPTGTMTLVARFDLDYSREDSRMRSCVISDPGSPDNGTSFFCGATWNPWTESYDNSSPRNPVQPGGASVMKYYVRSNGSKHEIIHPMPMFSDIEFTGDGKMIIGIRDRTADMFGDGVGSQEDFNSTLVYEAVSAGDVLIAAPSGGTYVLENNGLVGGMNNGHAPNGNEGPGGVSSSMTTMMLMSFLQTPTVSVDTYTTKPLLAVWPLIWLLEN